jgi:hypothetical protein
MPSRKKATTPTSNLIPAGTEPVPDIITAPICERTKAIVLTYPADTSMETLVEGERNARLALDKAGLRHVEILTATGVNVTPVNE